MKKIVCELKNNISNYDNNQLLVRYILAFAVFYSHTLAIYKLPEPSIYTGGHSFGWYAVNGFFFISGVLIAQSFSNRTLSSYFFARVLRLFPAFISALIFSALVVLLFDAVSINGALLSHLYNYIFINFLPVQAIQYGAIAGAWSDSGQPATLNTSLWTIPFEFFCYLFIVPFMLGGRWSFFLKLFWVFMALYFLANLNVVQSEGLRFDFLRVLAYFILGVVFFQFLFQKKSGIFLVIPIGLIYFFEQSAIEFFLGLLLVIVITWFGFYLKKLNSRLNKYDLSYGFYVYAWPVSQLVQSFVNGVYFGVLASFVVLVVISYLSYFLIEKPMLLQKEKLGKIYSELKERNSV